MCKLLSGVNPKTAMENTCHITFAGAWSDKAGIFIIQDSPIEAWYESTVKLTEKNTFLIISSSFQLFSSYGSNN